MYVYKDILEKLKKAGYSTYKIRREGILAEGTMQAIRDGKPINVKTIDTICQLLKCRIEDIVEVKLDD